MSKAKFVWCDDTGLGRNVFVIFRRSFSLLAAELKSAREAVLNIFADTRYRLWINGQIVAYGPARFVPSHPEYDRVDLRPWLRKGRNAIVVEANSYGSKSFDAMPSTGGFIAWGTIRAGKTVIDLSTPGEWRMRRSDAWDAGAAHYSFAQAPAEICDLRALPAGVHDIGFDDRAWSLPVVLAKQDAWGPRGGGGSHGLTPRSVRMLTMDLHRPESVQVNSALAVDEEVIAGYIPGERPDGKGEKVRCCFAANIYSPVDQEATLGLFWGSHYLNGQAIAPIKGATGMLELAQWNVPTLVPPARRPPWYSSRSNRQDFPVRLGQGWNFLYGESEVLRDRQGIMLGLPAGKGLVASVDANPNSPHTMMFSEGMPASVLQSARGGAIPRAIDALPSLPVPWHRVERGTIAPMPARLIGWDVPASAAPPAMPHAVEGIRIPANTPWVVLFDLGCERMGHVALDIEAAAGTILDIAYDERIGEDGLVAIYYTNWSIDSADRFITAGGRQQIEGFRPRGCRYVQISVRNNAQSMILHRVEYRQTILPMDVQGRFDSSDPVLDWIYAKSVDSIRTCTDTVLNADAWRENAMYINDVVPIYNSLAAFTADSAIMRRCLRLYAHGQAPDGGIPGVVPGTWRAGPNFWFCQLLGYYFLYTGDLALLRELWPAAVRALDCPVNLSPRGLIDVGDTEAWFDWGMSPQVQRGESFSRNAHRFASFQQAANIATLLNDTKRSAQYRAQAAKIKKAFRALWDPATHRYAATLLDGKPLAEPSPHANVLALYFGLAEKDKVAGALAYVVEWMGDEKFLAAGHMELAYHFWALEVLYEHGRVELAEHVIRRTWGIMKTLGAWSIWETLSFALISGQQLCQGWGTAPLMTMARRILGVRPTPGHPRDVLIAPTSATLRFARGAVAHPAGPIDVDWRILGQGSDQWLELSVYAPKSVKLRVEPQGPLAKLPLKFTRLHRPATD